MRFSITGGSDVTGSAERAPLRPALFDRLAVGVITVANSSERADLSPIPSIKTGGRDAKSSLHRSFEEDPLIVGARNSEHEHDLPLSKPLRSGRQIAGLPAPRNEVGSVPAGPDALAESDEATISAPNSSRSAASGQAALSGECPEASPVDGARKGPSGTAATACKPGGGALLLITGDKDRACPVGGPTSSDPDPRTLAGADGRRSTPSLLAVGAKSDGASPPSSVGAASERNVGVHESRQAVPYSPWAVRRSSNSLRSTYP